MKNLWLHKEALNILKEHPFKTPEISGDLLFYGTVKEVKEFTDKGYSKFEDWKIFFSLES